MIVTGAGIAGAAGKKGWMGEAPAKVNLLLRVLAREEGGYHQIETVFQALELSDRLKLIPLEGKEGVELELSGVPQGALGPDEENLTVRAARGFLEAAGRRGASLEGVRIVLEKRIPHGGGLGGGSSDAATVLRGLNALTGGALDSETLLRIGGKLGADVPFFLSGAVRALAWGRGDRLLPLPSLPVREVVLALPAEGVATPWAYGRLVEHRRVGRADGGVGPVVLGLADHGEEGNPWETVAAAARNDFEEALFPLRPELARIRDRLVEAGARPALLSGSGAAVFGIFEGGEAAGRAAALLMGTEPGIRVIRTRTAGKG